MDVLDVKDAIKGDIKNLENKADELCDVKAKPGDIPKLETARKYAELHSQIETLIELYSRLVKKDAEDVRRAVLQLTLADSKLGKVISSVISSKTGGKGAN